MSGKSECSLKVTFNPTCDSETAYAKSWYLVSTTSGRVVCTLWAVCHVVGAPVYASAETLDMKTCVFDRMYRYVCR